MLQTLLCNSHVHVPSGQRSSCTLAQDQQPACDNDSLPPPPRSVGLRRTWTFSQLPFTLPNAHSMFARDDDSGADPTGDNLVDEVSPSDDNRLAESVVCGESKSIRR